MLSTEEKIKFLNYICYDDVTEHTGKWLEKDGVFNTIESVFMTNMNLKEIPVQFDTVGRNFYCYSNQLTSLEDGPKKIGMYYDCSRNQLINLLGAPETCNNTFWCDSNQLTSLEGCPRLIKNSLFCDNNPLLKYLWGIGRVEGKVYYDNRNEINEWIITCARRNVIFPHFTLEENINWIKREQKYSSLLGAPEEIRQHFSPRILNNSDLGIYNVD